MVVRIYRQRRELATSFVDLHDKPFFVANSPIGIQQCVMTFVVVADMKVASMIYSERIVFSNIFSMSVVDHLDMPCPLSLCDWSEQSETKKCSQHGVKAGP